MSLACKILASFLLIFIFPIQGAAPENDDIVWGTLGQDIDLNIPGFQMNDHIDDIRWEKGKNRVARLQRGEELKAEDKRYNITSNGTLKIKQLKRDDNDTYRVVIYDKNGKNALEKTFQLKIQETVSTPVIFWGCINKTVTCEVANGTDPELKLSLNETDKQHVSSKVIKLKWSARWKVSINCTAANKVSKTSNGMVISCSEKGLDIYFIIGVCVGGTIFITFMALLIFYINKRKKQNSRRNDEELEIRACRVTTKERGRKPCQAPGSTPQSPAASQPPPPPSHRPQAPGHRPPPSGHRVQHNQQRKAPPPPATQGHQQKGPPLPRPRVQPKAPRGATENS